ncbi:uncharacterized protein LOC118175736 [Oxyura jamaicensis]|uniref:uncharacterized protein LOC118175736 n=1 Tax=Oxyura jamaicensis TaxID=8884 RepID=UPI0015A5FA3A|nr:uncharacterized protein LOC118175736 [Oxyura jamaicensis]XP_035198128.1 uncharacterized protein LOC118175736 [Oxyura jamaicensis]XP_035198129.1 uncharacterized protein LOC118175736 [Oxyura jamaicensis]XP_035198130.1 uncharacterized protein LOC118175736 [Oxyura jamaicensis]XP_035198131.1 uncharacterized protein LOC118175736 [Oxyura jamaicensis]
MASVIQCSTLCFSEILRILSLFLNTQVRCSAKAGSAFPHLQDSHLLRDSSDLGLLVTHLTDTISWRRIRNNQNCTCATEMLVCKHPAVAEPRTEEVQYHTCNSLRQQRSCSMTSMESFTLSAFKFSHCFCISKSIRIYSDMQVSEKVENIHGKKACFSLMTLTVTAGYPWQQPKNSWVSIKGECKGEQGPVLPGNYAFCVLLVTLAHCWEGKEVEL